MASTVTYGDTFSSFAFILAFPQGSLVKDQGKWLSSMGRACDTATLAHIPTDGSWSLQKTLAGQVAFLEGFLSSVSYPNVSVLLWIRRTWEGNCGKYTPKVFTDPD